MIRNTNKYANLSVDVPAQKIQDIEGDIFVKYPKYCTQLSKANVADTNARYAHLDGTNAGGCVSKRITPNSAIA